MPTYDYKCTNCKQEVELNVPILDRDNDRKCPECNGRLIREITFRGLTWAPTSTNGIMR